MENSTQVIKRGQDFSDVGAYLILDNVKKQCLFRKVLSEEGGAYLVSQLIEGELITEFDASRHQVLGKVIQSIINH